MITIPGVDPLMIANNITPYKPTHPGEMIKEEIEFRGISQRKLAEQMGISHTQLNEIIKGKRPVNTEVALMLEAALGMDAQWFINMQNSYNMLTARKDSALAKRLEAIRKLVSGTAAL